MSDFQRLMDSSPFLPDKSSCHGERIGGGRDRGEVTPPLSPDDLKYIEEFNSKGWELATALSASCPIPGPLTLLGQQPPPAPPTSALEAWAERADVRRPNSADPTADPFQPSSWYLTTSATLTTSTLSSPEHCQRIGAAAPSQTLSSSLGTMSSSQTAPEHFGVRVLHSPTRTGKDGVGWVSGAAGGAGGYAAAAAAALELNLSDDMKEVAFSVRNAIRPQPPPPPHPALTDPRPPPPALRDSACQTNGVTSRGTQTCHVVSVGLQTDGSGGVLRALTSSPHRCLTPKGGGSTPVSSPSRSLRRPQYASPGQAKFERPCCSPKYGSPKLQRKPPGTGKTEPAGSVVVSAAVGGGNNSGTVGGAGGTGGSSRTPTPTSTPQKGNNESAWARSTTTRDSPVHTTINDGLSSLFNIIDHTPLALQGESAGGKFTRSPSRARPQQAGESTGAPPAGSDVKCAAGGVAQELLRGSGVPRGRSPSPVQQLVIVEMQGSEVPSIRQDLSAPPGHTLAENTARLLNRKLQEQSAREERRLQAAATGPAQGAHGRDTRATDSGDRAGCMEVRP